MKVDLARLNHVLIPATKAERDRYRAGWLWGRVQGLVWMASRTTREGRLLLATTSIASVFAVDVLHTEAYELVVAAAALVFASLLFTSAYRLEGVEVESTAPRRVTVGDEITFTVAVRNQGDVEHRCVRVERPLLSWDGKWVDAPRPVGRLLPHSRSDVYVRARFVERGEHHIDRFRVAALVPMGLSQGPPLRTDGARFVVVPRIAQVTSLAAAPSGTSPAAGETTRASRAGDAQDLRGVRSYRPGDSVRKLHARSWARHGAPMIREYQQEDAARTALVIDHGDDAGSDEALEGALSLAAGVVARSLQEEAAVEWLLFGREAHALTAGRSRASLDQALDLLAGVRRSEGLVPERVLARLGPLGGGLSSVVVVLLAWDATRARLVGGIRALGLGCKVLVVKDPAARVAMTVPEGAGAEVPLDAIRGGRPLAL